MDKLGIFEKENSLLSDRFKQFFIGTQIAAAGGALNLAFFGDNLTGRDQALYFRLDFIVLLIGVVATFPIYSMLGRGRDYKPVIIFLWLWTTVMTFAIWFEGGLYSTLILSLPILFTYTALFLKGVAFLSICGFMCIMIVLMGSNHVYGWLPPPDGMRLDGTSRVISVLILTSLASYSCWVLGKLLKISFEDVNRENKRVIQSQYVIRKLAHSDGLTGSLSRTGADSAYQSLLKEVIFDREHIITYFIGLDNFKNINDLFDHHAGDRLLITIGERLNALLNQNGFVCRFGGDEFVLVLQAKRDFDIDHFVGNIMESLRQPHFILGTEIEITASVGIAVVSDEKSSFTDVCKKADMAMSKAKRSGKNQHYLYSEKLQSQHMRNVNIVNGLESAIRNDLLDVYFQPKINLQNNKVEGAEALLRWHRGNKESIGPSEFIPVIESTELIHSIGEWVINESCRACKVWQRAGRPIKVAVNVSALQLVRPGFYQIVVDALEKHELPPELLEIEITEHSLIVEVPVVSLQLEALKKLGVELAIDDFGTGYSNIAYLTQLQVDVLKLDRRLITQIDQVGEHHVIVNAVIKMAKELGMKVVAEGVETEAEELVLKSLNCDYGQGFLWSQALSGSELMRL